LHPTNLEARRAASRRNSLLEPLSKKGLDQTAGGDGRKTKDVSRRVLVVEDNLDAVHSLVVLLRQEGHQVDFAINGYAALEVARRFRPEVMLLDLGLPGIDGFDVCRRLKSAFPEMRVIAVTAYGTEEQRGRAREAGCDLHIVKPYDPQRLLAIVRSI
jgi:two-component system CheB/CheR fusion protein